MSYETNCPKTPTPDDFEAAEKAVHEYFDLGRLADSRSRAKLAVLKKQEDEGKRKHSKLLKVPNVITSICEEKCLTYSHVSQARQTARAFSSEAVSDVLAQCEAAEYLPNPQLFIVLTKVPVDDRQSWLDQLFINDWAVRELNRQITLFYGVRSNGGRKPRDPASVTDLIQSVRRLTERYEHVAGFIQRITSGVVDGPEIGLKVPRPVAKQFKRAAEAVRRADEALQAALERLAA